MSSERWRNVLLVLSAMALVACSSAAMYRPQTHRTANGYQDYALGPQQFQVHYVLSSASRQKVMDYAMLRAAELTLSQSYDWFMIEHQSIQAVREDKRTERMPSPPVVTRDCGLLACRTSVQNQGLPSDASGWNERTALEAVLQITLGKGVRPALANYHDASEVVQKLAHLKK